MDNGNIQAYFQKMLEIKNQRKGLSEQELKEIAFDLGMSEAEWQAVQQVGRGHIDRGYNFLEHNNQEDAFKEFQQALVVFPDDAEALYGLAHIHELRFLEKRQAVEKTEALILAHQALQSAPAHHDAARLISELKNLKPITTWQKMRKPVVSLLFIALVVVVGYQFKSQLSSEIQHFKAMFQARKGAKFVLQGVYFESGSTELHNQKSEQELKRLIKFLKEHPKVKGEIAGHTDNTGSAATNLNISTQRALAVYQYLIQNGANGGQLSYRGYGAAQPKFANNNPVNRRKNRRIEFKILQIK